MRATASLLLVALMLVPLGAADLVEDGCRGLSLRSSNGGPVGIGVQPDLSTCRPGNLPVWAGALAEKHAATWVLPSARYVQPIWFGDVGVPELVVAFEGRGADGATVTMRRVADEFYGVYYYRNVGVAIDPAATDDVVATVYLPEDRTDVTRWTDPTSI